MWAADTVGLALDEHLLRRTLLVMGQPRALSKPHIFRLQASVQITASALWAVDLPDDSPTGGFFRDGRPVAW